MNHVEVGDTINLPTKYGALALQHFSVDGEEGVVITKNRLNAEVIPVRIHSSCLFSESIGTTDCDCADQLNIALNIISKEGGVIVYMYDEGRGIGLKTKFAAIKLQQEKGCDTRTAFKHIGSSPDPRSFEAQLAVLKVVLSKESKIELITNNLRKIETLRQSGLNVVRVRPCISPREEIREYLREKSNCLGHIIDE